jgi:hypothetical protein
MDDSDVEMNTMFFQSRASNVTSMEETNELATSEESAEELDPIPMRRSPSSLG